MIEEISVYFGEGRALNGIVSQWVSEGDTELSNKQKPAIIILNSGLLHRVGPCRSSVTLAREAAKKGHICLRFDHSGIGDSSPRLKNNLTDEDRILEEIKSALDYIEKIYHIREFYLFGLCSGAQDSFKYTVKYIVTDRRVIGLIGIDHYGFSTFKFYVKHYLPRIFRMSVWQRRSLKIGAALVQTFQSRLGKKIDGIKKGVVEEEIPTVSEWQWPPRPSRDFMQRGYQKLVDNNVRLFYIYTGSMEFYYNYADQFVDMYPKVEFKAQQLFVDYLPRVTHLMPEPRYRKQIIDSIVDWVDTNAS